MRFCLSKQSEQNYVRESLCKVFVPRQIMKVEEYWLAMMKHQDHSLVSKRIIFFEDGSLDEDKGKKFAKFTSFAGPVISNLVNTILFL